MIKRTHLTENTYYILEDNSIIHNMKPLSLLKLKRIHSIMPISCNVSSGYCINIWYCYGSLNWYFILLFSPCVNNVLTNLIHVAVYYQW